MTCKLRGHGFCDGFVPISKSLIRWKWSYLSCHVIKPEPHANICYHLKIVFLMLDPLVPEITLLIIQFQQQLLNTTQFPFVGFQLTISITINFCSLLLTNWCVNLQSKKFWNNRDLKTNREIHLFHFCSHAKLVFFHLYFLGRLLITVIEIQGNFIHITFNVFLGRKNVCG